MPKTQKETVNELTKIDRTAEEKQDAKKTPQHSTSVSRVASQLPNMPGPKPGGLAESMGNPERLQESLNRTRQRRVEYENAKGVMGIKTAREPAQTTSNKVNFAEGMTHKGHEPLTVNGNPRFAQPKPVDQPADQVFKTNIAKTHKPK